MTLAHDPAPELLSAITARRVRGLMGELKLNQDDVARVIGVSRTAVSDRLRGVKAVDLDELPPLAEALNVSVAYLLGLTDLRTREYPGRLVSLDERRRQPRRLQLVRSA